MRCSFQLPGLFRGLFIFWEEWWIKMVKGKWDHRRRRKEVQLVKESEMSLEKLKLDELTKEVSWKENNFKKRHPTERKKSFTTPKKDHSLKLVFGKIWIFQQLGFVFFSSSCLLKEVTLLLFPLFILRSCRHEKTAIKLNLTEKVVV